MPIDVPIKVGPSGQMPQYASPHAAGCDLFATMDLVLLPGQSAIMPMDFIIALPEGYEAQVRPRSGLSLKTSLRVPNSPGTIDADYRNPVGVIIQNIYNPATLPGQLAAQPSLLADILRDHRPVRLRDRLADQLTGLVTDDLSGVLVDDLLTSDPSLTPLLDTTVLLDKHGNPYGTIYLHQGERIAQMVIARHEQANFVDHPAPEQIGVDRGGGFGSTGR